MHAELPQHVSEAFLPHPPKVMGVAVSGGSDSMALLHLMREFCELHNIELHAVTVDHSLRAGSAHEAAQVAKHCQKIGVPHETLVWNCWEGKGNLQGEARKARYQKMADWARENDINTIAVGHTADDQAETVLMRLSRRSGVDGLSGMSNRSVRNGITWVRPLLGTRRDRLQAYLREQDISWLNDPSNDDQRFDRIKARHALTALADLGIDAEVLAEVASHLSKARRALDWQTFLAGKELLSIEAGAVVIDDIGFHLQPDEIQRRLLVNSITWISGSEYAPRRSAVGHVMKAIRNGQAGTVDGCHIRRIGSQIWVFRETNSVRGHTCQTNELWDGRWRLTQECSKNHDKKFTVRALGFQGLQATKFWRSTGIPHAVLQSTPAVWQGETLVAAPLAGDAQNWHATLESGIDSLFAALISH